jgi:hypothetical protein
LSEAERGRLANDLAGRAMALLRQAVDSGFKDVAYLKRSEEFAPLRGRGDFQDLIRSLEAK